tara:strand:- start:1128 stop:5795 length:4668 start_codon:yes stop_codon:yes gene_type:complete
MPIDKYTNKNSIDESLSTSRGEFLEEKDSLLIRVSSENKVFNQNTGSIDDTTNKDFIELHLYDTEGNYLAQNSTNNPGGEVDRLSYTHKNGIVTLKLADEVRKLGYSQGKYIVNVNVLQNIFSNAKLFIDEISPTRKEIRVRPVSGRRDSDYFTHYHTLNEFYHFGTKTEILGGIKHLFDLNEDSSLDIFDLTAAIQLVIQPGFAKSKGFVDEDGKEIEFTKDDLQIIIDYLFYALLGPDTPVPDVYTEQTRINPFNSVMDGIQGEGEQQLFNSLKEKFNVVAVKILSNDRLNKLDNRNLNFFLNFGDNNLQLITNWMIDNVSHPEWPYSIVIKLYKPLPDDIETHQQFDIVEAYSKPIIEKINLFGGEPIEEEFISLGPPNEKVETEYKASNYVTPFENWDQLLSINETTSQQIIDTYLSQSIGDLKLNVDYSEYSNFINFSSAEERLKNFRYKLSLIEHYDAQMTNLSDVTGSKNTSTLFKRKKRAVISGFDGYEKHLYYNSGSGGTIYNSINFATGSEPWNVDTWDTTWPKTTSTYPYTLASTSDETTDKWYQGAIESASMYDRLNPASLRNNLPLYLHDDPYNSEFVLFMDMIGQHFDVFWAYTNHLTKVHDREEGVYSGIHKDFIYNVAKSLGANFNNGGDLFELWKYGVGENIYKEGLVSVSQSVVTLKGGGAWQPYFSSGSLFVAEAFPNSASYTTEITDVTHYSASATTPFTGEFTNKRYALSFNITGSQDTNLSVGDSSKEIWKRILNNLPYLMKTKGTARSVKALISCYGIPQTILSIREYGGPDLLTTNNKTLYERQYFDYALKYTGNSEQYFYVPWKNTTKGRRPDSIEFRFRPKGKNSHIPQYRKEKKLLKVGESTKPFWDVRLIPSLTESLGYVAFRLSGSHGYKSISSSKLPLFDNESDDFWNVVIQRTSGSDSTDVEQQYNLYVQKAQGDRIPFQSYSSMSFSSATSASYKTSWTGSNTGNIYFTDSGSTNYDGDTWFSGSIQRLRLWNVPISESVIDNHTRAPYSSNGNTTESFYDDLEVLLPFDKRVDHDKYPYVDNVSYATTYTSSATVVGFGESKVSYEDYQIDNWFETPNLGPNRWISNKIRVESASIDINLGLSPDNRMEQRAYDFAPTDSPKLGVYFSPTLAINDDIIGDLAGISIDDLIGDPSDRYRGDYSGLSKIRDQYFKRYNALDMFWAYLRLVDYYNRTLFDQIKALLPERAHEHVGVLIEPNLLERSKHTWKRPSKEEPNYEDTIKEPEKILTGSFSNIEGTAPPVVESTGSFDQLEGIVPETTHSAVGEWSIHEGSILERTSKTSGSFSSFTSSLSNVTTKDASANLEDLNANIDTEFSNYSISESTFINQYSDSINMKSEHYALTSEVVTGNSTSVTQSYQGVVNTSAGYKNHHFESMRYTGSWGDEEHLMPIILHQVPSDIYLVPTNSIDNITIGYSANNSPDTQNLVASNGIQHQWLSVNYNKISSVTDFSASEFPANKSGYIPAEYSPRHKYDTGYFNLTYGGCKNTINTTIDKKEPVETFDTAPTQLVVSKTSPNTLKVE